MDPSVYRRRLRNTLRETRESLGIIQATAAAEMTWSVSKLIRIETGMVTISVNDLKALLGYYKIDDPERILGGAPGLALTRGSQAMYS